MFLHIGVEVVHHFLDGGEDFTPVEDITATEGIVIAKTPANDITAFPLVDGEDDVVSVGLLVGDDGIPLRTDANGEVLAH